MIYPSGRETKAKGVSWNIAGISINKIAHPDPGQDATELNLLFAKMSFVKQALVAQFTTHSYVIQLFGGQEFGRVSDGSGKRQLALTWEKFTY